MSENSGLSSAIDRAYLYYFGCSIRNRLKHIGGQLRRPRYIVGFILICLYIFYLYNRIGFRSPYFLIGLYFFLWLVNTLLLPISSATTTFSRALSFRLCEVQQLFVAPLSRRRLLQFKLMQNQWSSILMATIFTLLSRNIPETSVLFLFLGVLLISNLLNLHTSLQKIFVDYCVRKQQGYWLWLLSATVLLALGITAWLATQRSLAASGEIMGFVNQQPFSGAVNFMLALFGPAFASSWREFFADLWLPGLLLLTHGLLFFTVRFPFEDNAIVTADMLQKLRQQGASALRRKKTAIKKDGQTSAIQKLAPTGPQWRAIFWKNWISIVRLQSGLAKRLLVGLIALTVVAQFIPPATKSIIGLVSLVFVPYIIIVGPALLRMDLRIDIPHFDYIKGLPIHGRQLIFGAIMASQLYLFGLQVLLLLVSFLLFAGFDDFKFDRPVKLHMLTIAIPAAFALTFFMLTAQNLMALHLPSLSRLGRRTQQGFDQIGQNVIGALMRLISLAIALIPAAMVGALVGAACLFLFSMPNYLAILPAAFTASVILFGEALLLIYVSDNRYRFFDISEENIKAED